MKLCRQGQDRRCGKKIRRWDCQLDHDRYEVYVNGGFVGQYNSGGSGHALQSIERWLLECGILLACIQQLGNRIDVICDHPDNHVKRRLHTFLSGE